MRHQRLGRTALQVSELCLGTMNFGPNTTEVDSFELLDHALDNDIDFVDTADRYGGSLGVGATETIIGNWLAQGGDRRERIVLATKLYGPMSDRPNERGLSARHIRLACDASLRRLQTDHIDLYQMHHIDRTAPWDEVWQAMETLVAQGKISYVGSSNFAGWNIAQANEAAASRHFLGLVSEQSLYNLVERRIELEVIPACEAYGVGVLPWSPLSGGMLAGVLSADNVGRRSSTQMHERAAAIRPQLEAWEELCSELGESSATIGLAWLLHQPAVTAPIIGPRTMEQLDDAVRAPTISLSDDVLRRLDEIFPGPGPAPEAYAW